MKTKSVYLLAGVLVGLVVVSPWEGELGGRDRPGDDPDHERRGHRGPRRRRCEGQVAGRHGDHPAASLQPRLTTRSIGRSELLCTFVDRRRSRVCRGTYFLPKGKIIVGGSLLYRQFYELAVLGGTGLYDNARGSLVVTRMGVHPVRDRMVFRLVG